MLIKKTSAVDMISLLDHVHWVGTDTLTEILGSVAACVIRSFMS